MAIKAGDRVIQVNDQQVRVVEVISVDATHATVAGPPVPGSGGQAVATRIPVVALRRATSGEINAAGLAP